VKAVLISLAAAFGLTAVAGLTWLCQRDPGINFLPPHKHAEWIFFPSAVEGKARGVANLDTLFRREFILQRPASRAFLSVRAAKRVQTRGDEARRRARALGQARPDLVGWLVLHTRALSDAARGAAWQGFELACEVMGATLLPPVDIARLVAAQADNDELALTIAICHPRFADRYLSVMS